MERGCENRMSTILYAMSFSLGYRSHEVSVPSHELVTSEF